MGKGTFFNYFPTKEHVLATFGDERVSVIERAAAEARNTKGHVLPVIKNLATYLAGLSAESPALLRSIFAANAACAPVRAEMQKRIQSARRLMTEMFAIAQQRGEIRGDLSAGDLARLTQLVFHGVTLAWALNPGLGFRLNHRGRLDADYAGLFNHARGAIAPRHAQNKMRTRAMPAQIAESFANRSSSNPAKAGGGGSLFLVVGKTPGGSFFLALTASSGWSQAGANAPAPAAGSATSAASQPSAPPGQSGNFSGSVPSQLVPGVLPLSLEDAIGRGLKQNLGLLLSSSDVGGARGQRLQQLSALMPHVNLAPYADISQVNLAEFGFTFHFPGVSIPTVVGPVRVFRRLRANLDAKSVLDLKSLRNTQAATGARESRIAIYVQRCTRRSGSRGWGHAYLQAIADEALIEAVDAQVKTAQALYNQASDQVTAGTSPAIDALRARVELHSRQQQLIQAKERLRHSEALRLARHHWTWRPGSNSELTDRVSSTQPFVEPDHRG